VCAEGLGEGFGGECGCAGDGGYEWVCFWGVSGEGGGGFGGGVGGGGGGVGEERGGVLWAFVGIVCVIPFAAKVALMVICF